MGNVDPKRRLSAFFTVEDDGDSEPIEGATIQIDDTDHEQDTDEDGQASFDLLPGTYDYTVNADGYQEETGDITIVDEDIEETVAMMAE